MYVGASFCVLEALSGGKCLTGPVLESNKENAQLLSPAPVVATVVVGHS